MRKKGVKNGGSEKGQNGVFDPFLTHFLDQKMMNFSYKYAELIIQEMTEKRVKKGSKTPFLTLFDPF